VNPKEKPEIAISSSGDVDKREMREFVARRAFQSILGACCDRDGPDPDSMGAAVI